MPLILAIEADPKRRILLRSLVNDHVNAELFIAESVDAALEHMGRRLPDVVLAPALLSPQEGAALSAYVRQLQDAPYVQLLTMPALDMLGEPEVEQRRRFGLFRRRRVPSVHRYDRAMVGEQIADAVVRAREAREEYVKWLADRAECEELERAWNARQREQTPFALALRDGSAGETAEDRRTALRKSLGDIPWLSGVRLAWDADVALVNISSSGVLLESGSQFVPGSTTDLHLDGPHANLVVPVHFVRSEIAKIDSRGVTYHAAGRFGHEIDLAGPPVHRGAATSTPHALAALLETALAEAEQGAEAAHIHFVRGLSGLVGARTVQLRSGVGSSGGRETLYFEVPTEQRARMVLQVVFDRSHNVSSADLKLLRAAAWLTAAALELDRPQDVVTDPPVPVALLAAQVA